jgi:hypothetical protein
VCDHTLRYRWSMGSRFFARATRLHVSKCIADREGSDARGDNRIEVDAETNVRAWISKRLRP